MEQLEKDIIKIIMKEMIYKDNDIDPKKVQECLYSLKDEDDDYEEKIQFDSLKSKKKKLFITSCENFLSTEYILCFSWLLMNVQIFLRKQKN